MRGLYKYLVVVIFFLPIGTFAQTKGLGKFISNNANISLTGGQIYFDEKNYWLPSQELFPINTIGLDFETSAIVNRGGYSFDWRGSVHFFIPNRFKIGADEIKITGNKFSFLNCGFDLFPKIKKFDLLFLTGISFGKFKQKTDYENGESSNFRNSFCLIEFSLQPRYVTKYVTFSLRPFYGYDISGGGWRGNNTLEDRPPITKLSIYGIDASIGFTLFNRGVDTANKEF